MKIDQLVFGDLIADYNRAVDSQTIIGTGARNQLLGLDTLTGVNSVTDTDATPTVGELYSQLANAIRQVHEARFAPPDAVLMAPRRWAWILAAADSTGRPLVEPNGNQYNSPAVVTSGASYGQVGEMLGLPVYTDANIPTTLGAGTEDEIYVARFTDQLFMEGPLRTEVFRDIGSANGTVRFRVYAFLNYFCGRFPAAVFRIKGTGLSPTF
jgi:HK97 family phage major capsid protein